MYYLITTCGEVYAKQQHSFNINKGRGKYPDDLIMDQQWSMRNRWFFRGWLGGQYSVAL